MWRLLSSVRNLVRRERIDRELDTEIGSYRSMLEEKNMASGMKAPEARRAANLEIGGVEQVKESVRAARAGFWIETFFQDLRFGGRILLRNPGFSAVAILTLALGIGVNATVFSLANAILYKNLPFKDSERVLYVMTVSPHAPRTGLSYPDFRDVQAQAKSFEGLGANTQCQGNFSDSQAFPETYNCSQVTANTFHIIGQTPVIGRDFAAEDEKPGAASVAILSYGVWENRYAKDASVLGRTVRINSEPTRIIGVMPRGIEFPRETQFWLPYIPTSLAQNRTARDLNVFGRLAKGASVSGAKAEFATIASSLAQQYPEADKDNTLIVRSFTEINLKTSIRAIFVVMLGAVGFVLLIACANVANLLLGRAVSRTREMSIRNALGAGSSRIVRQLVSESLIMAVIGGGIGLLAAQWGIRTFDAAITPLGKPTWMDFSIDYRAFGYFAAITLASAIAFGLAPALRLSRVDVNSSLRESAAGAGLSARKRRLSTALVVAETSLAFVLLAGAGLMIRSFLSAYASSSGFDTSRFLSMRLDPSASKYPNPADQVSLYRRVAEKLAAMPGAEGVSLISTTPGNSVTTQPFEIQGVVSSAQESMLPRANTMIAGANYFETIRVGAQIGRTFTDADGVSGPPVAIINRGFANAYFEGSNPIGAHLRFHKGSAPQPWLTIVGVVPDLKQADFTHTQNEPVVYTPYAQSPRLGMWLLVRAQVSPGTLGEASRSAVRNVDSDLPARDLMPLDAQLALSNWPLRVFGSMFAIFAAIALLLASVGLYAVVAHTVSQRTHEIGLRIALGATPGSVMRMIFAQGLRPIAAGLALGFAGAFAITRVLGSLLSGVSATDPATFALVALALAASAFIGCAIPARRAMKVDPLVALRHE